MSFPSYDELMLPLLKLAADNQEHPIAHLREQLAQQLQLTPEQRAQKIPSGRQRIFDNRVGWASTYLDKAKLIDKPRRGRIRITQRGLDILAENPTALTNDTLKRFPEFRAFKQATTKDTPLPEPTQPEPQTTPDETIGAAYATLQADLRDTLRDRLQHIHPAAFEQFVLQLLHAMGYGGSTEDVEGVPRGPDGGIDGTIKEDPLGLDIIYIQAKRWQDNVGRAQLQAFQGALSGVGARKGVFLTTSSFTANAIAYARQLRDSRIILIDGQTLAQLAIDRGIGVSVRETFTLKRLDEDFFSELEDGI